MKNAFQQFRKHWIANLVTFIFSLIVATVIFLLMFFLRDRNLASAVDGLGMAAMVVLLFGLLAWMAHLGAFDTIAFGFKQVGSMLFARNARRDGNYADYRSEKAEKRTSSAYSFISIIAAGVLLSIALLVLYIVYRVLVAASF